MNQSLRALAVVALAALGIAGCSTSKTEIGGPSDMAIADQAPPQEGGVGRCEKRLGTVAITESEVNSQALMSAGLPRSMAPLVRHLLIRSGCFNVVDRGAAYSLLEAERRLREQLGTDANATVARHLQPLDYILRAEIVFAEQIGQSKGVLGGVFGDVIGGIGGQYNKKEAVVLLSVVDARTSEITSSVFGRGTSDSAGLGSLVLSSGVFAIDGGWADTPQAKTVAAALVDAWNRTLPKLPAADIAPPPKAKPAVAPVVPPAPVPVPLPLPLEPSAAPPPVPASAPERAASAPA